MDLIYKLFVEDTAFAWLKNLGYPVKHGPEIAPGEPVFGPWTHWFLEIL